MLATKSQPKPFTNSGFTLPETIAVAIIIGIVAAIAVPSLLGFWRQQRVKTALVETTGAIKEAQRQAMRQGRLCRVNIEPSSNQITGSPSNCLLSNRFLDSAIVIRTNLSGTPPNIAFSYKGTTTKSGTIVISSNFTNLQKCFVISLGTGISRTGNYTGSPTGNVSASNCQRD